MSDENPSPLRYPGGKRFLTQFLAETIELNDLSDGLYVEPCAGGAGAALSLLFGEYVSFIHLNDVDQCIYSFWKAVLRKTEEFLKLVRDTPLNVATWKTHQQIVRNPNDHSCLELGFATFYLNRCNRSGALNAGPIGGKEQTGNYLIDARFNRKELGKKIEKIGLFRDRICVTGKDAVSLLKASAKAEKWNPRKTIVYLDPPYHDKGKRLYQKAFDDVDHARLARFLHTEMSFRWLISYDDVTAIRRLYAGRKNVIFMNYFMHTVRIGRELIISSTDCALPKNYFATRGELAMHRLLAEA